MKNSKDDALAIDGSGNFPSGESFKEFKQLLKTQRIRLFTRHLISQLIEYSTGRFIETEDQFEIDDIQEKLLVVECLMSDIFHSC